MTSRTVTQLTRLLFTAGALVALLAAAPSTMAFDARQGERVVVGGAEVIEDDLYVAGQRVTIDGTVNGDLVVAGQVIVVNGVINGGLIAAGQTVIVNGTVRDTARVAAQAIQLGDGARIGRDLMAFAYSLETRPRSFVGRDVGIGAYQALLAGTIERSVRGGMQGLDLRGTIGGDVEVTVGTPEEARGGAMMSPPPEIAIPLVRPGLAMADSVRIAGRLKYTAAHELPIRGTVEQGVAWEPQRVEQPAEPRGFAATVAEAARRLVALAIAGVLLMLLVPRWTERLSATMHERPLPSIGWGLVAVVVVLAAMIGVAVGTAMLAGAFFATSLAGLGALVAAFGLLAEGALVVGFIGFTALVGQAIVAYMGGAWVLQRSGLPFARHRMAPLLVGVPILVVLTAIPYVGGLIGVIAALAALGALWLRVGDQRRPAPAAMAAPQEAGPMAA